MSNYPDPSIPVDFGVRPISSDLAYAADAPAGWYPYQIGSPGQLIAGFREVTNDGPYTVDTLSDMVCPGVPVTEGRAYLVWVIVSPNISVAAGRWDGDIRVDGVVIGRAFSTLNAIVNDPAFPIVSKPAVYIATETTDVQFELFLNEITDGTSITLGANTAVPRWLLVFDIGVLEDSFKFGTW